jgi:hypothetical protein
LSIWKYYITLGWTFCTKIHNTLHLRVWDNRITKIRMSVQKLKIPHLYSGATLILQFSYFWSSPAYRINNKYFKWYFVCFFRQQKTACRINTHCSSVPMTT